MEIIDELIRISKLERVEIPLRGQVLGADIALQSICYSIVTRRRSKVLRIYVNFTSRRWQQLV
jgi:hypothetical protein